jgi:hypothetical protein
MNEVDFDALVARLNSLRKERSPSEFGEIPASIALLESTLSGASSDEERHVVYSLLVNECSKSRNDTIYVHMLRRRVRDFPADPMYHAGLAFRLALIEPNSRIEALRIAEQARTLAKAQDRLVRYCATNLARIAMMIDDYEALKTALLELVEDAGRERADDTNYEFDFVNRIDSSRCGVELLARYEALR